MYDVFFFNDTATTEIYTLSLHDALPIFVPEPANAHPRPGAECTGGHPTSGSRGQRSAGEARCLFEEEQRREGAQEPGGPPKNSSSRVAGGGGRRAPPGNHPGTGGGRGGEGGRTWW